MNIQPTAPATTDEIAEVLKFLFASLPLPRGTDPERAIFGYITALSGLSLAAIENGIRKVLRSEDEEGKRKFCPRPPELAAICRGASFRQEGAPPAAKAYGYHQPSSKVLETNVTKAWAFRLIEQGIHPRGSIWVPGPVNDKPELGDLHAPDPHWPEPWLLSKSAA